MQTSFIKNNFEYFTLDGPTSFLSLGENLNLKASTKTLSNLDSKMSTLLNSKSMRKKRSTQDGRFCSQAFVQDGKTYFDCTNARSPDGQMKNKEWCYVDSSHQGVKNWDYCKPIMDYDKVRLANVNALKEITIDCRKLNNDISQNINPAQNALDELKRVKDGQVKLDLIIKST